MRLFTIEHSRFAYRIDFALYGLTIALLSGWLMFSGSHQLPGLMTLLVALGMAAWTLIEYLLHRFVLHGIAPFRDWHAEHHQRPTALICTPTILSATLIVTLIFLPALMLGNVWRACAITLGVLIGYMAYALTHHAMHHGHSKNRWLKQRQYWHALHHRRTGQPSHYYGVTTTFWDAIFGTTSSPQPPRNKALIDKATTSPLAP